MAILGVLCGPNEPKVLTAFIQQALSVFREHGPYGECCRRVMASAPQGTGTPGLAVVLAAGTKLGLACQVPQGDGTTKEEIKQKYLFLDGVFADSPARAKLTMWMGHAAQLGCGWCRFHGQSRDHAVRFLGYVEPVKQQLVPKHPECCVGDPRVQLTHG